MRADDEHSGSGAPPPEHGEPPSEQPRRRRVLRGDGAYAGVLAGVLTALAVLVVGGLLVLTRSPDWTASTQLLVGPGSDVPDAAVSSYYETLSRGQIVATAAQLVGERRNEIAAAQDASVNPARIRSRVAVMPETALVDVTVTAPTETQAEDVAEGIARRSLPTVNTLLAPYQATLVSSASATSRFSGPSDSQLVALSVLVAVVAGVAVWQLTRQRRRTAQRDAGHDLAPAATRPG